MHVYCIGGKVFRVFDFIEGQAGELGGPGGRRLQDLQSTVQFHLSLPFYKIKDPTDLSSNAVHVHGPSMGEIAP